jgi:hypothetical protein
VCLAICLSTVKAIEEAEVDHLVHCENIIRQLSLNDTLLCLTSTAVTMSNIFCLFTGAAAHTPAYNADGSINAAVQNLNLIFNGTGLMATALIELVLSGFIYGQIVKLPLVIGMSPHGQDYRSRVRDVIANRSI